jgi:hypothetical protein
MKYFNRSIIDYAENGEFNPDINEIILSKKILVNPESLNKIKYPKNANVPIKCFDPIMFENVNITKDTTTFYITNEDGKVISASCLDSESLDVYKKSRDYVFYRCKDSVPISALHIKRSNTLPGQFRLFNFQFKVYVKDSQSQSLQSGKKYILSPVEDLGRIVSLDVIEGGSLVSSVHCGPSDGSKLYNIKEIDESINGGRKLKKRTRKIKLIRKFKKTLKRHNK